MFDKLMVTKQVKMTHVPDRYHGQIFEILWGTALNRDTDEEEPLTRARMSMCHVCVSITSDTSMSEIHPVSQGSALRAWPLNVPVIKLT